MVPQALTHPHMIQSNPTSYKSKSKICDTVLGSLWHVQVLQFHQLIFKCMLTSACGDGSGNLLALRALYIMWSTAMFSSFPDKTS